MIARILQSLTGIRDEERRTALLSFAFFFFVLAGYYILRPLREDMGVAGGVRNLPWLYLANLLTMLALAPIFGAVATRFPRRVFIASVYRFVMATLIAFYAVVHFAPESWDVSLGRFFYVWISVLNMWIVSLFWAVMADVWGLDGGKRLFGFIAMGGTVGAIVGSSLTTTLVDVIGRMNLVLVSVVFFEFAVRCVSTLAHRLDLAPLSGRAEKRGGLMSGITATVRSPYLLGIAVFLALYSLSSTFLYFAKANIVADESSNRITRTILFANIDLVTNIATLLLQLLVAGRLMPRIGVGRTLLILPVVTALGFTALGLYPLFPVLVVFEALRRALNYAIARPARETLFTVVTRDEKYKAKSFIDTFVYRGGDMLGATGFGALTGAGVGLAGVAFTAVPIAALWGGIGLALGAALRRRATVPTD